MKNLRKLIYLLTLRERKRAGLLVWIVLIMSLLEMAGLASIVPFMAVLANPEVIETNSMLNTAFQTLLSVYRFVKMQEVLNFHPPIFPCDLHIHLLLKKNQPISMFQSFLKKITKFIKNYVTIYRWWNGI